MITALALMVLSQAGLCGAGRECQVGGVRYQQRQPLPTCDTNRNGTLMQSDAGLYQCQSNAWSLVGAGGSSSMAGDAGVVVVTYGDGGFGPLDLASGWNTRWVANGGYQYMCSALPTDSDSTILNTRSCYYHGNGTETGIRVGGVIAWVSGSALQTQNARFQSGFSGTASTPDFTWSGSTGTGMYTAGAGTIGWSQGGTATMQLSSGALRLVGAVTGSLPTCASVGGGSFLYDSSLNVFNGCASTSSYTFLQGRAAGTYTTNTVEYYQQHNWFTQCIGLCAEATSFTGSYTTPSTRQAFTKAYLDCTVGTAGVGASGTQTISLIDVTNANATVGTGNLAATCTAVGNLAQFSLSGTFTNGHQYTLRYSKGACTTASTNIYCNVRFE